MSTSPTKNANPVSRPARKLLHLSKDSKTLPHLHSYVPPRPECVTGAWPPALITRALPKVFWSPIEIFEQRLAKTGECSASFALKQRNLAVYKEKLTAKSRIRIMRARAVWKKYCVQQWLKERKKSFDIVLREHQVCSNIMSPLDLTLSEFLAQYEHFTGFGSEPAGDDAKIAEDKESGGEIPALKRKRADDEEEGGTRSKKKIEGNVWLGQVEVATKIDFRNTKDGANFPKIQTN